MLQTRIFSQYHRFTAIFFAVLALAACALQPAGPVSPGRSEAYQRATEEAKRGDTQSAYTLYEQAIEQGDALGHFSLGMMMRTAELPAGVEAGEAEACRHFQSAAEAGIPYAQHLTGECLERGVDQPADVERAIYWYQQAAQAGHVLSNCNVADLYLRGQVQEKTPGEALGLCESAATTSPPARLFLARLYLLGDEAVRDYAKALQWLELARASGQPEADHYLGMMSEMGLINEYPPQRAYELYEAAATQHYAPSYLPSGRLYLQRPPEPQSGALSADDLAKGYMWLRAAQQAGSEEDKDEAEKRLQQVLAVMPESWRPELDERVAKHLSGE